MMDSSQTVSPNETLPLKLYLSGYFIRVTGEKAPQRDWVHRSGRSGAGAGGGLAAERDEFGAQLAFSFLFSGEPHLAHVTEPPITRVDLP